MSEDGNGTDASRDQLNAVAALATLPDYKVLGDIDDSDGVGVLGRNVSSSGTTAGVEGRVASPDGFGLATPDDARIEGAVDTAETDFRVRAGTTGTGQARNVVLGHEQNGVGSGVVGATIGGGGQADGSAPDQPNRVEGDFGTVSGGKDNRALDRTSTVAGGGNNEAALDGAVVGGGGANYAGGEYSLVGGGLRNDVFDDHGTVAGGRNNTAGSDDSGSDPPDDPSNQNTGNATYATVGGGEGNEATAGFATVSGGKRNKVRDDYSFVGGGSGNLTGGTYATLPGGANNDALGQYSTVGGGWHNKTDGKLATIAGGGPTDETNADDTANEVRATFGTVGGGGGNTVGTSGQAGTVSGGRHNEVTGEDGVVGGGSDNLAGGSFGGDSSNRSQTVGGGTSNSAIAYAATVGGGERNVADGSYATVPGGEDNRAQSDYAFAAGRRAKAKDPGTFVWADRTDQDFASSEQNKFLVQAANGSEVYASSGQGLFVRGISTNDNTALTPGEHAAFVDDASDSLNAVLGLAMSVSNPDSDDNFLTFFDGDISPIGSIEGQGGTDINLNSGSADYAEYLPRLDPSEEIEPADVVGVVGGSITKDTEDADGAMVVTDSPIVTGNSPGQKPEDRAGYEQVAFVGQIPVKVRGTVDVGDLLVPSGTGDGTAEAIDPTAWRPGDGPLVGRAWEGTDDEGLSRVVVAVGIDDPTLVGERFEAHRERIAELEAENEALRERLQSLETRVSTVEGDASDPPVSADD